MSITEKLRLMDEMKKENDIRLIKAGLKKA